jgi:hypothetical protein
MMSEFDPGPPPAAMIQKMPHPSSRDAGKLITDWRAAIEDLRTAVTPDLDGTSRSPRPENGMGPWRRGAVYL